MIKNLETGETKDCALLLNDADLRELSLMMEKGIWSQPVLICFHKDQEGAHPHLLPAKAVKECQRLFRLIRY